MTQNTNTSTLAVTAPNDCSLPPWLEQCPIVDRSGNSLSNDENNLICRAFEFAYQLHRGQYRKSGEPYIAHPVAVASVLRDLGGDSATIAAGFLHDVVEDTEVTPEEIEAQFGTEVRQLVEGVTKLSSFNFSSKTEQQAENFRRMFLAMAKDIRVIVVKLADRLHNMRTLDALKPEKQQRIARETREIFAPLANRLGIWRLKWELEDLGFKYLEPKAYRQVQALVAERRIDREQRIEAVIEVLRSRLHVLGIEALEINGRPKHLYSIYQKMARQNKEFHEIYDIAAIRLIVQAKDECYRALAVVHDQFKPIPGRFKDYIGLPKPNRYQSLHTTVVGLTGRPLEVQIRTLEMHRVAEYGIAAHWIYKESGGSHSGHMTQDKEKFTWLRQLLEWQNDLKDAREYVENLKENLFYEEVYVFTPNGDVVSLNRGATPVDFAYRIHTEIGNHMKGARVNGRWTGLDRVLNNGDIVEIITSKNSHPSLDWLNYAVTPSARNRIRQWFKRSHREENVARGRELLEKELGKNSLETLLKSDSLQQVAERCNYQNVEDLLAALGYGEVTLNHAVNRLREAVKALQPLPQVSPEEEGERSQQAQLHARSAPPTAESRCPIAGVEGLLYGIAGCCNPVPGEAILGVVTRSKGISIHRQGCSNLENIEGERLVPVSWNPVPQKCHAQTYLVNLQIEVIDRVGIFKDILARLSDQNINVSHAGVKTSTGKPASIDLGIQIRDRQQLELICNQIRKMSDVLNLRRISSVQD